MQATKGGEMDSKSSNPAFSQKAISRFSVNEVDSKMTVGGSVAKIAYSLVLLVTAAFYGWSLLPRLGDTVSLWWIGGIALAAMVMGFVAVFRSNIFTVTGYAILEGVLIGLISRQLEAAYGGIVLQAVLLTFSTTIGMLALFSSGLVTVTKKLRSVILIATVGVLLYLIFEFLMVLFNPGFATVLSTGPLGITIAAVITLIAALNLLLDFDFISRGVKESFPKKAEWYAAFGLLVTLVWLYVSILRLLAASRR